MTHSRLHEVITFGREMAGDSATIDALEDCRRQRWSSGSAQRLVTHLLRDLPDRLAHSLSAGEKARRLSGAVQDADADLLVSAALLHDIGYAKDVERTGFHPLDGAEYLLAVGAPYRLAALVAHHSEARELAEANGLLRPLSAFRREPGAVTDALVYADMSAGPHGESMSLDDRLCDIEARHRADTEALIAARRRRVPRLRASAKRTERRLLLHAIVRDAAPAP